MRKIITLPIFSIIMIYSCTTNHNKFPHININEKKISQFSIDKISSDKYLVPLETNNSSIIKEISKVIVINDTIIIGDFSLGKVHLFNKSGKHLNSIYHIGKGPQEYININDISFDYTTKLLHILDLRNLKIKIYNLNGQFIKDYKFDINTIGYSFEYFNNCYVFHRRNSCIPNSSSKNIIITNGHGQIINKGVHIPSQIQNIIKGSNRRLSINDSIIYVLTPFNDTIYKINPRHNISPEAIIRLPRNLDVKKTSHWSKKHNNITDFHEPLVKKNMIIDYMEFANTSNYIIFKYFGGKYCYVIYNKKDYSYKIVSNLYFSRDKLNFKIIGNHKDYFISEVNHQNKSDILNKYLDNKINFNSNPVLLFFKLK